MTNKCSFEEGRTDNEGMRVPNEQTATDRTSKTVQEKDGLI